MTEPETFESILNREMCWPREEDKPFRPSDDKYQNATIDPHGHGRLVLMMNGYKQAADLIVEREQQAEFSLQQSLDYDLSDAFQFLQSSS